MPSMNVRCNNFIMNYNTYELYTAICIFMIDEYFTKCINRYVQKCLDILQRNSLYNVQCNNVFTQEGMIQR